MIAQSVPTSRILGAARAWPAYVADVRDETLMEQAERHVREADERVARQEAILADLERAGSLELLETARSLLTILRGTRKAMRDHLEIEKTRAGR
jgi:hypothetical protein